ncbi:MAG: Ada metal-binding domain-containing protein [Aerococcus urinaeequi]|uniref:bifunctional transcriptional activator/DNA repair enzyme AdaA n=1 Tax=Aerococcus urinaeequi TaxID=51665 RepID=UPI0022E08F7E|nr:Ada metal-binding domain-containing protein [Aerococcus urinaeequi]
MVTNQEWQAIKENDPTFDDVFRYAVKTTKIFCKPSCHSRLPKRENIEIYYDFTAPEKAGYRPCKRCRPTDKIVDDQLWASEIEVILQENYDQSLTLGELAHLARGSSSHLRHVFKKETGLTPQQRLMAIRLDKAKEALIQSDQTVEEIAQAVGITNVSYFIRKFKEKYHITPKQFRIKYG